MEQKIAPDVEHRLTRAIEKAASLMAVNMDRNPNELIAGQLKQANVDKKFARVAAQAFNKRATVIHLSKTADEHKADDFPLADPDTVYELCGGVVDKPLAKAASVVFEEGPFVFAYTETVPEMIKAAAAELTGMPPYEDRVDVHVFHNHLESVMDKCAATFRDMNYEYDKLEKSINERAAGLARWFNKTACQSFEFTTAAKLFGQDLKRALGDRIPDVPLEKSAAVVNPNTPAIRALGTLLDDMDKLAELKQDIVDFGKSSMDFIKTAAAWGEAYTKAGGKLMDKNAANWKEFLAEPGLDMALTAPGIALESGMSHLTNLTGDMQNMGTTLINGGLGRYWSSLDRDVSPGKVLEADFINRDRMRDRMMAISDLSADKSLTVYPFKDVMRAATKAMDSNMALERPDKREILRAYVSQLLPQNNRAGMADLAALNSLNDSKTETRSGAEVARSTVSALDKERGTEFQEFKIPELLTEKETKSKAMDALEKRLESFYADDRKETKDRKKNMDTAVLDMLKHDHEIYDLLGANKNLSMKDLRFVPGRNGLEVKATKKVTRGGRDIQAGQTIFTLTAEDVERARGRISNLGDLFDMREPVNLLGGGGDGGKGKKGKGKGTP